MINDLKAQWASILSKRKLLRINYKGYYRQKNKLQKILEDEPLNPFLYRIKDVMKEHEVYEKDLHTKQA